MTDNNIYWPFPTSTVTEWPGSRPVGWADHVGTDFGIPHGSPLRATASGRIDIHWTDGLGAWVIDIHTPDGKVVRNGHLSYMAVADGEWVNAGDYIGNTGGTINTPGAGLSTGAHLHWEIRNNPGWGAFGWYDPRQMDIKTFDELDKPVPPIKRKNKTMHMVYFANAAPKDPKFKGRWALGGPKYWLELASQASADNFAKQYGIEKAFVCSSAAAWNKIKKASK